MSQPFLGEIMIFAGNFAPRGWALCNGQLLAISSNTALYSIIGTYYGGNGTTNFQLPNLQGRYPRGVGQGTGLSAVVLGEQGGTENETLTVAQMPAHTHTAVATNGSLAVTENVSNAVGTVGTPNGAVLAKDPTGGEVPMYNASATSGKTLAAGSHSVTGAVTVTNANTGGNQPHPVLDPFLGLTFCIALVGIFPSRN
jgi:microcystin-dependent protein